MNPLNVTIATLDSWEKFAFDNESAFLDKFCCDKANDLTEISWSGAMMRFVYVSRDGQHICDSIPLINWILFLEGTF